MTIEGQLISQLVRLYLPVGRAPDGLAQHVAGQATRAFDLVKDGAVRAIVIPFEKQAGGAEDDHWQQLCAAANALQGELGLPAPAVSVSGATGFRLWLSFEQAVPLATAQRLFDQLCAAYLPGIVPTAGDVSAPVELPPCLHQASGKWAAFIHPGMGASFADEPALEMAPPAAAQAAFLEGLTSITPAQLQHAMDRLRGADAEPVPPARPAPDGLLLKDATLEDIVRFLHAKNIEPTFRHLLKPP